MSQKKTIEKILLSQGEISRNTAIRELYITRLSAIILNLKNEGWEITGEDTPYEKGLDYTYYLKKSPYQKIVYRVPELEKDVIIYR